MSACSAPPLIPSVDPGRRPSLLPFDQELHTVPDIWSVIQRPRKAQNRQGQIKETRQKYGLAGKYDTAKKNIYNMRHNTEQGPHWLGLSNMPPSQQLQQLFCQQLSLKTNSQAKAIHLKLQRTFQTRIIFLKLFIFSTER